MKLFSSVVLFLGLAWCARERHIPMFSTALSSRGLSKAQSRLGLEKRKSPPKPVHEDYTNGWDMLEEKLVTAIRIFARASWDGNPSELAQAKAEIKDLAKRLDDRMSVYRGEDWEGLIDSLGLNHRRQIVEVIKANM